MHNDAGEFERSYLSQIPPSYDPRCDVEYYPASAKLKDGSWREKVIFIDRSCARRAICSLDWLESHGTRLWGQVISIDPNSIREVPPSKDRLDPEVVAEVHRLNDQRRYCRMLITKDDHPIFLSTDIIHTGLGMLDFPVLPCEYKAKDVRKAVGYNYNKKILIQQIKEDVKQQNLPSALLDKIRGGWRPEKEAKSPEPWELCYCIYPSISEGDDSDHRILGRYGSNILKRDDVNNYNYPHFQESVNICINEERRRKMGSSSLIHKNGSFFDNIRQGDDKPNVYEPKNIDENLLQGLSTADEGRYLVKATLKDGTIVDNVVLVHESRTMADNWSNPPFMSYARCK